MRIPLIWLKDYLETDKSTQEIAADFTQLGLMLDRPLDKTNVLDLEQRLNRSDLLSMIGCARDLAAFEGIPLKLPKLSTKPGLKPKDEDLIPIQVKTPVVRRFQTRVIKGIKVGPSPNWLSDRLKLYGMESINNIVDITNYVMIEYAQPIHAQDITKLPAKEITLRPAKDGEQLTTLLGTKITLDSGVFILTSGGIPTVIGGIVGGANTRVTSDTTQIILDSGNYDSRVIRRTSRQLKITNETVSRYDKFLDPRTIDFALDRATQLILELAGGTYYANDDYYPSPVTPQIIALRMTRLRILSGMDISLSTAKKILKSLEYVIIEEGEGTLTLEVPYFRTDVEVEDDLVSDILRIHNYTKIPLQPLSTAIPSDLTPSIYTFEDKLRDLLLAQGAHEHITSSLTASNDESDQILLVNALTSEQNALRTTLVPGLTHVLSTYKKHKLPKVPVFEIGKVFRKTNSSYLEGRLLSVIGSTDSLATLLSSLGIQKYTINQKLEILIGDQLVGSLSPGSYTIVTDALMPHVQNYSGIVSEFTHSTSLDLSLLAPSTIVYADIIKALSSIKARWHTIICKSMTRMNSRVNNYLLTITWPASSNSIQADKEQILATLKSKLKISSNS